MAPRRQPEQQAPPVQRLRVRYAKRGRARFASHRDFGRAFERALRRAGVPMAFSSGFSPHPRISYANAAPTGAATEAEYLELGLSEVCDPKAIQDALNEAMPQGLLILTVVPAGPGALAERLTASRWEIRLPGVDPVALAGAATGLLAAPQLEVERMTKNGLRRFDVRPAVLELTASGEAISLVSAIGEPLVRPDDVLQALQSLEPSLKDQVALLTRLEQGRWDGAAVADPLLD